MRWASIGFLLVFAVGLALIALGLFALIRYGFAAVPALLFAGGAALTILAMIRLVDEEAR